MTFDPHLKSQTQISSPVEERIIAKITAEHGPTLIFFGGVHGNEPAGIEAIRQVFRSLKPLQHELNGSFFGIRGNIPGGILKTRFVDKDLNRIWTAKGIAHIQSKEAEERNTEEKELLELYSIIAHILETGSPPFYFFDLHTTSSPTSPFITLNDALINRRFARHFPVPIILGIEEYLQGPLLSYINELGYVSLGFESGQHDDPKAVDAAVAFIWLAMTVTGFVREDQAGLKPKVMSDLREMQPENMQHFYEIIYKHDVLPEDHYAMEQGFESFKKVAKGTLLATHNKQVVYAREDAILFMPLYQAQGEEGFFLIRKIPNWALRISRILRGVKLDKLLLLLPGVSSDPERKGQLVVNKRIARFFTKPFFHLLGYRNRELTSDSLLLNSRERVAKTSDYSTSPWFQKKR